MRELLGADPGDVLALAGTFDDQAASVAGLRGVVSSQVLATTWVGDDLAAFSSAWFTEHVAMLNQCESMLRAAAASLRGQADQQRIASEATSSGESGATGQGRGTNTAESNASLGAFATDRSSARGVISSDAAHKIGTAGNTLDAISGALAGIYAQNIKKNGLNVAHSLESSAQSHRAAALAGTHPPKEGNQLLDLADDLDKKATDVKVKSEMAVKASEFRAMKIGGGLAIGGAIAEIAGGKDPTKAIVASGASFASSVAAGAAIGTLIPVPVVGTVAGAVGGAVVGVFVSGVVDSLFEEAPDVEKAAAAGWKALVETKEDFADLGSAAWGGFSGLFS